MIRPDCINSALRSSWRAVVEMDECAMWGIGRDRFGVGRPTIERPKGRALLDQIRREGPCPYPGYAHAVLRLTLSTAPSE